MTPNLHALLETVCADKIPAAWLSETFMPCNSVRQWLGSMEEHVRYVQDCYYSRPAVLWLPAFLRPDRLFSAVVQTHARQTFQDVADIMLTFKVSMGRTDNGHGQCVIDRGGMQMFSPSWKFRLHVQCVCICAREGLKEMGDFFIFFFTF